MLPLHSMAKKANDPEVGTELPIQRLPPWLQEVTVPPVLSAAAAPNEARSS